MYDVVLHEKLGLFREPSLKSPVYLVYPLCEAKLNRYCLAGPH